MPKNQPRCHCGGEMKRNGKTSANRTRWRCKICGASTTKTRSDITHAAVFRQFIEHCTSTTALTQIAGAAGVSHSTMKRRFSWCWLVDVPDPTIGHEARVYDQIFLDGTYTAGGCLIVAATLDHVIAWHWCTRETTRDYQQLCERIPAPLIAVIDGGQGAASAIKTCWPGTKIQRCLVHAQRVVRRYTTSCPRTDAGRAIYQLALNLTTITTLDEAARWGAQLHEYGTVYRDWMRGSPTLVRSNVPGRGRMNAPARHTTASTTSGATSCYLSISTHPTVCSTPGGSNPPPTVLKAGSTPSSNCLPAPTAADPGSTSAGCWSGGSTSKQSCLTILLRSPGSPTGARTNSPKYPP